MPRVSVIVPNYNHGRFLDRRLRSIRDQTLADFEIIFLDDASRDDSREAFARHADDPRIAHAIFYPQNSGCPFVQWNRGLALARGDHVWIAESDDYAYPTFLEELVARLDADPRVGIAMSRSYLVNALGHETLAPWQDDGGSGVWSRDGHHPGRTFCASEAATGNPVPNASGVVFRRSVAVEAGPADESYRLCGDWLFWVSLLERSDFYLVAKPLNCFRMHEASVRSTAERAGLSAEEHYRVANLVASRFPVPSAKRKAARWVMAHRWGTALWRNREPIPWSRQRRILREAWKLDPAFPWRLAKVWWALRREASSRPG